MTKKIINKIMSLIIIMTVFLGFGFTTVKAASVPSSIKVTSIGKLNYGGTYYFPVKYTSDGTLAYCTEFYDQFPMGVTMTNPTKVDNGLAYIIANGYHGTKSDYGNDSKMKQYYITQLAIYTYLGQANPRNNNDVHNAVWDLVNKAKAYKNESNTKLNVSLNANNTNMKLTSDGRYFISDVITVSSNNNNAEFTIGGSANVNTEIVDANGNKVNKVKNGSKVYARIPASTIQAGQSVTISVAVNGQATKQTAYVYTPCSGKYQTIIPSITYPETESTQATIKVKAAKEKIQTKVKISKQDITSKEEIAGAKLKITDLNGKEIISWVSSTTPKLIKNLKPGKYYLEETQAPDGYILSTEKKEFEVKEDGTVTSIVFYNEKQETKPNKVAISKQDMTTKQELPGATLVIKDANGKEIDRWVSTNEVHYVELEKGTYTLTEVIAPKGYVLSTETITFTVDENGNVDKPVIMYNTKAVEVPITDANVPMIVYLIGALGMIFGFTKVLKNAKLQ